MALEGKLSNIMGITEKEFPEKIKEYEYKSRFKDAEDVDRVFCEYRLIWRNLMKYYLEEIFDDDLDNFYELTNLLNNFGEKFYGGIDWVNYAFSDKYKDEHNPQFARAKDFDMQDKKFTNMSLYEVLELWGIEDVGEFIVPDEFKAYLQQELDNKNIETSDFPAASMYKKFEAAEEIFNELVENNDLPKQSAYALIGAMWTECGWNFSGRIYNQQEKNCGSKVTGTWYWSGCGECWCQITFWKTKEKLIKALNPPGVPHTEEEYKKEHVTHLCDLDQSWQVKLALQFIKNQKMYSDCLFDHDGDPGEQIVASYGQKAGQKHVPGLSLADAINGAEVYMKSHKNNNGIPHPKNGFAKQVFASMKFSGYMSNKERGLSGKEAVPSDDDIINAL